MERRGWTIAVAAGLLAASAAIYLLHYCRRLKEAYPYIFSIVVRIHPLQEKPDPVVRS